MREYRPSIDGIRTVAVLSVVFFHAEISFFGIEPFRGGFVGVDVFFVISGYLITGILLEDLQNDQFSLLAFYERRARRIVPALFVVLIASIYLAWLFMTPKQIVSFGKSIVWTALSASNFFFWRDGGDYFSEAIQLKPLFHTWSLAVEEQFYICFPLLLCALHRRGSAIIRVFMGIALLSLFSAQWMVTKYPSAAFYLLPTRVWELMTGAILAVIEVRSGRSISVLLRNVGPIIGLTCILVSIFSFSAATPHPSVWTLFPVGGTALLIWTTGGHDLVTRFLSWRPMVGVGLISYSLYLWHQPLFAFARLYAIGTVQQSTYIALIGAAVILAYLSWAFIEKPFRRGFLVSRAMMWTCFGASLLLSVAVGGAIAINQGFLSRLPDLRVATGYTNISGENCYGVNCVVGADVPPSLVLIGDSHAALFARSFDVALRSAGLAGHVVANGDIYVDHYPQDYPDADDLNEILETQQKVLQAPNIRTVILAGRHTLRVERTAFDNGEGGVERLGKDNIAGQSEEAKLALLAAIENGIIDLLRAGKRVVLIYPIPEAGWHVPATLSKMILRQIPASLSTSHALYLSRNARVLTLFDSLPDQPNLVRIRPDRIFCNTLIPQRCATHTGSNVFYHDDDHLSRLGADLVVERIMQSIAAFQK